MSAYTGLVVGAAQLGYEAILVKPKRSIGPFIAQVTIEETHQDDLEITDHPVELGANISDHAFKMPSSLVIRAGWNNSPSAANVLQSIAGAVTGTQAGVNAALNQGQGVKQIKEVYSNFLKLQADRTLIDVFTGKRVYKNMLIKSIIERTDLDTENSLILTITLRQVIVVSTQIVTLTTASVARDPALLADPKKNQVPTNSGTKLLTPANPFLPTL